MGVDEDLEYGKKLLPYMEEFLEDLLNQGMSRKTFLISNDLPLYVPPPSRGRTGGGWGCALTQTLPHPHPDPPLEGEGELLVAEDCC
ncbi:MAG: hypothetical protein A2075_14590 [Geobacteraceae bacterium GWC2_58_44]|nr:MAG: hypothetical protein A2075_14590 [Geobacteraceae bacterium GWC2_58_44]